MQDFITDLPAREDYWNLFETSGWNREYGFTAQELHQAISNSWYAVSAYENGLLVGFGRILSDGIHHALIVDVIVRPTHQDRGIGREIVDRLVARCREARIRDIQLFSAKGKSGFYRKLGFVERDSDAPGMELI